MIIMKPSKKKREIQKKQVDGVGAQRIETKEELFIKKLGGAQVRTGIPPVQEVVGPVRKKSDQGVLVWQAPEYEFYHKDVSWYWMSFVIAGVLVLVALWQRNFLFAIFVTIAWFTFSSLAGRVPAIWQFSINEKGLAIGPLFGESSLENRGSLVGKFYAWQDILGFAIHDQASGEYKELILKLKARFSPYITIPFPLTEEAELTARLLQFLPKEEYTESLADTLSKLIRF